MLVTDKPEADRAALLAHAQAKGYPELWVPSAILVTAAIPVMGTGKVDYRRDAGTGAQHAAIALTRENDPPLAEARQRG